jgi:hypothetical protein
MSSFSVSILLKKKNPKQRKIRALKRFTEIPEEI